MKRITLFLVALLSTLFGRADGTLPTFSTTGDTTWYYVRFYTGSNVLKDAGKGSNMVTAALSVGTAAQQFALFGSQTSFRMVSRLGNNVYYNGSRYATSTSSTNLKLVATTNATAAGCWEIQRVGGTMSMNQWGGTSAGAQLGEWTAGDSNNPLSFVPVETELPVFSTDDSETWYFIQFKNSGYTIADQGTGANMLLAMASPEPEQLWKLVGTRDNFQLVNKLGRYAGVSSSNFLVAQTTQPSLSFKLVASANSTYAPAWEVQRTTSAGTAFNEWQGAVVGNKIGFWTANDVNNPLAFVKEDKMTYADYKVTGSTTYAPENKLTLWYTKPTTLSTSKSGDLWMEYALPLGNGQFGAMVYGGIAKEQIQFNEKTLWSGRSTDNSASYGDYENFGSVFIENLDTATFNYTEAGRVKNYYRNLDLTNATANVGFTNADETVAYTRQYVASNPDGVVAMRLAATGGKQSVRISLASGKPGVNATPTYTDGEGTFSGKLETVSYNARVKVVPTGGTMTTTAAGIEVKDADEIFIVLGGATDFDPAATTYISNTAGLASTVSNRVSAAATKGWTQLYADHVADYKAIFDRVDFQLDGAANTVPTDQMVNEYSTYKGTTNAKALMLEQLYYNYGRYLTIAGSRGVDLPTNLQGIWNNSSEPAWNGDIHANINVQMNYWPAEANNMSELHLPFLNYITNMAMNHGQWKSYATAAGQSKGWTCYTENNIFGGVGSFMHAYVIANAWYCTHLWQHYRYTLDKDFLKKAFPTMWAAAEFWLQRLILASDGTYECPNEYSPEHGPTENGVAHAQQLVWDLFANTKAAAEVLGADCGVSTDSLAILADRLSKLDKGLAIEKYTGTWGASVNGITTGTNILREWKYSTYTAGTNGHRHLSHLMCLYPFSQVQAGDPYFQAAVNSLQLRGDESTGWSMGWKINLWARAQNGNYAHKILEYALQHCTKTSSGGGVFYNLFDVHPTFKFQIDGNYGACAGISEMLLQSQTDTLQLLPALPSVWKSGSISGLKAVGDFTVNLTWSDGKAKEATITSNQGQPLYVKYPDIASMQVLVNGTEVRADSINANTIKVAAQKGDVVKVNFTEAVATSIGNVSLANSAITVSGRTVFVNGVKQTSVADFAGRSLLKTTKSSFVLNPAWGKQFIVTALTNDGAQLSRKVVVE